jgi:hypothetical protein
VKTHCENKQELTYFTLWMQWFACVGPVGLFQPWRHYIEEKKNKLKKGGVTSSLCTFYINGQMYVNKTAIPAERNMKHE